VGGGGRRREEVGGKGGERERDLGLKVEEGGVHGMSLL
jgi:hypothetical protein